MLFHEAGMGVLAGTARGVNVGDKVGVKVGAGEGEVVADDVVLGVGDDGDVGDSVVVGVGDPTPAVQAEEIATSNMITSSMPALGLIVKGLCFVMVCALPFGA